MKKYSFFVFILILFVVNICTYNNFKKTTKVDYYLTLMNGVKPHIQDINDVYILSEDNNSKEFTYIINFVFAPKIMHYENFNDIPRGSTVIKIENKVTYKAENALFYFHDNTNTINLFKKG